MLREPVRAGQINIEIFQNNDRAKLQAEINQWLGSHHDTMVYDILYSYGYTVSNPSDTLSQHCGHGYSMVIAHTAHPVSHLNKDLTWN